MKDYIFSFVSLIVFASYCIISVEIKYTLVCQNGAIMRCEILIYFN